MPCSGWCSCWPEPDKNKGHAGHLRRPWPCRCRQWPAVRRVTVPYGQLASVALGLRHAFCVRLVPGLGFNDCQPGVAVDQHVVGNLGPGAHAAALPSTTPQPAAFKAGSMCSARVSASFIFKADGGQQAKQGAVDIKIGSAHFFLQHKAMRVQSVKVFGRRDA